MTGPLIQALIAHSDSVFYGPNGDYIAALEVLTGLSAAQASWKPRPSANSIWQIVEHLIDSKDWMIDMLDNKQHTSPPWLEPSGGEARWQAAQQRLKDAHLRLKQRLAQVPEDRLLQKPSPELGPTLLELILSAGPAHEAQHCGQMDYLKGLQQNQIDRQAAQS